jgi:flagellar protein FliO/FliZ
MPTPHESGILGTMNPVETAGESTPFALQLGATALALAFVLLLAWLVLRGLRRLQQGAQREGAPRVLRAATLGTRERVVVVHYRGREYLLGVAAGGITVVDRWPAAEAAGVVAPAASGRP